MSFYKNEKIKEKYDYIVIGSGAAGAVIASRLSENTEKTVCLIEAGGENRHPYLHIPGGFIKTIFNPKLAWQFKIKANELTKNRLIPIPQGKVLGGSTSINGLVYNRGQKEDFDHWAALGNTGWSYDEVLPFFKRSENFSSRTESEFRGRSGELQISDIDWTHPLTEAFIEGASELGIPRNEDYNGATQLGVGYFQRFIHRHYRVSTATAFLKEAKKRKNLTIKTNTLASDILFNEHRQVVALKVIEGNSASNEYVIGANAEIIVSAGAINTPKLLQISGLGEAEFLRTLGVDTVADLPGVGQNLSDHYSIRLVAKVKNIETINELARGRKLAEQVLRWLTHRPNILALSPSLVHVFWKTTEELERSDIQGVFTPASYKDGYVGVLDHYPGMTCGFWAHRPKSKGYVQATSRSIFDEPLVEANYLSAEEDQRTLIKAVHLARKLFSSKALSAYYDDEVLPGKHVVTDDEILDFIRSYGVSSYHLNGTAKMGPDDDRFAVVDPQLRVRGVQGLRIADSSVMPMIPSANICASTIMIGEKAADFIKSNF